MIVIAGGSGLLGRRLARALAADGKAVTILTRQAATAAAAGPHPSPAADSMNQVAWTPDGSLGSWSRAVDGAAAVINLAGESIASRRWTTAQKSRLIDSRLNATRSLVAAIAAARIPPRVMVSASAIGYYGDRGDELLTEFSDPGDDFLARLCVQWEREAIRANTPETRVVLIRTGIVLDPDGGALARLLLPFKAGVGGPLGSGRQYMSWIHRDDWTSLVRWVIATEEAGGPINGTAPTPVTNREFSKTLGRTLHRPSVLPAPALALRLLLGEMADPLLLASQRVTPARAEDLGFRFSYPQLAPALEALLAD